MNKILFSLLVSGAFFSEIQGALAVRTMNAENMLKNGVFPKNSSLIKQSKVQKPAPMQEKKLASTPTKQRGIEPLSYSPKNTEKENVPLERIKGSIKIRLVNSRPYVVVGPEKTALSARFCRAGGNLNNLVVPGVPGEVVDIVAAKPVYHSTRSTTVNK